MLHVLCLFFGLCGCVAFCKREAGAVNCTCGFESKLSKNTELFDPHQEMKTLSQMVRVQYGEILMVQKYRLDQSLITVEKQPAYHD